MTARKNTATALGGNTRKTAAATATTTRPVTASVAEQVDQKLDERIGGTFADERPAAAKKAAAKKAAPKKDPVKRAAAVKKAAPAPVKKVAEKPAAAKPARNKVADYVLGAFADLKVGDFLTINQVRLAQADKYGKDAPYNSSVDARLFRGKGGKANTRETVVLEGDNGLKVQAVPATDGKPKGAKRIS